MATIWSHVFGRLNTSIQEFSCDLVRLQSCSHIPELCVMRGPDTQCVYVLAEDVTGIPLYRKVQPPTSHFRFSSKKPTSKERNPEGLQGPLTVIRKSQGCYYAWEQEKKYVWHSGGPQASVCTPLFNSKQTNTSTGTEKVMVVIPSDSMGMNLDHLRMFVTTTSRGIRRRMWQSKKGEDRSQWGPVISCNHGSAGVLVRFSSTRKEPNPGGALPRGSYKK